MNNFKKFKSGAGQAMESNDGASEALPDMFRNPVNQKVGLLEELEERRGHVKDLIEKLNRNVSELNLKELTVSKAELEERLRVFTYLVEELQRLNEELIPEAGQAKESNDEASEAIFGNPVILNNILELLPNSKLLELSVVNKFWKKEARIVMKKRGNVMALLETNSFRECAQVFGAFAAYLETLNETLYSGMTVSFSRNVNNCQRTGALEVDAIHESILAGMRGKLKRLSIRLGYTNGCWESGRDCPSFVLLRLLLRDFIGGLEHLTLDIDPLHSSAPFIQEFLPPGPYPQLKVLKLHLDFLTNRETFGNQIKMLLPRAPNLQEIHTRGSVSLRENLMEGREGVIHVHESWVGDPMQDISENVIPALRLKEIWLFYNAELELDRFNEKAQSLLRTCCATTLERLHLGTLSAVLFMSYGIRLLNVKQIEMNLRHFVKLEQLNAQIKSIMTRFDFTYFLPKLDWVRLVNYASPREQPGEMAGIIIEQANNAVRREPALPRAGNIKYLSFGQEYMPVVAVEFFSQMFPAIEKLDVHPENKVFPVESAWELWPELKLIKKGKGRNQRP